MDRSLEKLFLGALASRLRYEDPVLDLTPLMATNITGKPFGFYEDLHSVPVHTLLHGTGKTKVR